MRQYEIAGSNVNTTAGKLVTFDASDITLAFITVAIQADIELNVAGAVAIFVDGDNTYLHYAGTTADNADDQIIQLTGIIDITTITAGAAVQIARRLATEKTQPKPLGFFILIKAILNSRCKED